MSDEDMIRRGDALAALRSADLPFGYGHAAEVIRTIPAAQPSPDVAALVEAAEKLLDAYSAIVGAGNSWGDELRAALARVKGGA